MPTCSRCKRGLPPEAFNRCRQKKNGLQSRCRTCSRDSSREAQRLRRQDSEYRRTEREQHKAFYQANPEHRRRKLARMALRRALLQGKIEKTPCLCGNPESKALIADYSKPLQVSWLCRRCLQDPVAAVLRRFDERHAVEPLGPVKVSLPTTPSRRVA